MAQKSRAAQRLEDRLGALMRRAFIRFPRLVGLVQSVGPLYSLINRKLIERSASYGEPRPHPLSLRGDYTSWPGLHDRGYTGRQLPPDPHFDTRKRPPSAEAAKLFQRDGDGEDSARSSLLFAYLAQWFTDSFVRSMPEDKPEKWRRNSSNHDIDLCQIYGATERAAEALREQDDSGRLKVSIGEDGQEYPPLLLADGSDPERPIFTDSAFADLYDPVRLTRALGRVCESRRTKLYATGLEQGNATPGNLVLSIVFLRAHNHVAGEIKAAHPDWPGERVFETARNVMIVIFMQIVLHDYIRHVSPIDFPFDLDPKVGRGKEWKRMNRINIEFGLLYRWHPLVPDRVRIGGAEHDIKETLWNPELVTRIGIGALITAASKQAAGKLTLGNTAGLFTGEAQRWMDGEKKPISIQRKSLEMARRARLQPYNAYREAFGLERVASFSELTGEDAIADRLAALYGEVDNVEWFVGLFAEAHGPNMVMGELLLRMVAFDAFTHIFGNPLLASGVFGPETFSERGMELIAATKTLKQVVAWAVPEGTEVHVSFDHRPPS